MSLAVRENVELARQLRFLKYKPLVQDEKSSFEAELWTVVELEGSEGHAKLFDALWRAMVEVPQLRFDMLHCATLGLSILTLTPHRETETDFSELQFQQAQAFEERLEREANKAGAQLADWSESDLARAMQRHDLHDQLEHWGTEQALKRWEAARRKSWDQSILLASYSPIEHERRRFLAAAERADPERTRAYVARLPEERRAELSEMIGVSR